MKVCEAKGNPGYCASFPGPEVAHGAKLGAEIEDFRRNPRPGPETPRAGGRQREKPRRAPGLLVRAGCERGYFAARAA